MTGERVPTDAVVTLIVGNGVQEEDWFDYDDEDSLLMDSPDEEGMETRELNDD